MGGFALDLAVPALHFLAQLAAQLRRLEARLFFLGGGDQRRYFHRDALVVDRGEEVRAGNAIVERLRIRTASLETAVSDLSGGNQQKVLIGREMGAGPKVLLVDEPTKGVDVGARSEIYQRLRALASNGLAVVVSSSDGIELEGLCDRVLIFARGHVVRELSDAAVTDTEITAANLTATVSRTEHSRAQGGGGWHRLLSSDHFPALVLSVLTAAVLAGMQNRAPVFHPAAKLAG